MLNKKLTQSYNRIISFIWGFAEATIFFIVADVFLSYLTIKNNPKNVIISCLYCAVGSVLGGVLIYIISIYNHELIYQILNHIPLISEELITKATNDLRTSPVSTIFTGGFSGIPYKIFATQAPETDIKLFVFIFVSFFSRLMRFLFTIIIFYIFLGKLREKLSEDYLLKFHIIFWIIFYIIYSALMSNYVN